METSYVILSILILINIAISLFLLTHHYRQKEINIDDMMDIEELKVQVNKLKKELIASNYLVREIESEIKSDTKKKLEKLTEQIIKKIPITNDKLLKEVQQMRDDFFALRQNF